MGRDRVPTTQRLHPSNRSGSTVAHILGGRLASTAATLAQQWGALTSHVPTTTSTMPGPPPPTAPNQASTTPSPTRPVADTRPSAPADPSPAEQDSSSASSSSDSSSSDTATNDTSAPRRRQPRQEQTAPAEPDTSTTPAKRQQFHNFLATLDGVDLQTALKTKFSGFQSPVPTTLPQRPRPSRFGPGFSSHTASGNTAAKRSSVETLAPPSTHVAPPSDRRAHTSQT